MAGTKKGGERAAKTNKTKYGTDFYARIGALGGKKGHTGGFYANRDLARDAGRRGGLKSRRTKKVVAPKVVSINTFKHDDNHDLAKAA